MSIGNPGLRADEPLKLPSVRGPRYPEMPGGGLLSFPALLPFIAPPPDELLALYVRFINASVCVYVLRKAR